MMHSKNLKEPDTFIQYLYLEQQTSTGGAKLRQHLLRKQHFTGFKG